MPAAHPPGSPRAHTQHAALPAPGSPSPKSTSFKNGKLTASGDIERESDNSAGI